MQSVPSLKGSKATTEILSTVWQFRKNMDKAEGWRTIKINCETGKERLEGWI